MQRRCAYDSALAVERVCEHVQVQVPLFKYCAAACFSVPASPTHVVNRRQSPEARAWLHVSRRAGSAPMGARISVIRCN